jgi:hypothetical protein
MCGTPDAIIEAVVCEARGFCHSESLSDDAAMVVLKLADDASEAARTATGRQVPSDPFRLSWRSPRVRPAPLSQFYMEQVVRKVALR